MTAVEVQAQAPRRAGRPPCCSPEAMRRIRELKNQGYSVRAIARLLNEEGVPTPMGKAKWSGSHVHRVLGTRYIREADTEQLS